MSAALNSSKLKLKTICDLNKELLEQRSKDLCRSKLAFQLLDQFVRARERIAGMLCDDELERIVLPRQRIRRAHDVTAESGRRDVHARHAEMAQVDRQRAARRMRLQQQRAATGLARRKCGHAREFLAQQRFDFGQGEQVVGTGDHGMGEEAMQRPV